MIFVVYADYCRTNEIISVTTDANKSVVSILNDRYYNDSLCDYYMEQWQDNEVLYFYKFNKKTKEFVKIR